MLPRVSRSSPVPHFTSSSSLCLGKMTSNYHQLDHDGQDDTVGLVLELHVRKPAWLIMVDSC